MQPLQHIIFGRLALCSCTMLILSGAPMARSQAMQVQAPPEAPSNVASDVVDRARKGISQDLLVVLDGKDIEERESTKRRARGLQYNDAQLNEETSREFEALRSSVFPQGRLGNATVLSEQKHAPILLVRIPDLASLLRIASHPKVIGIERNDQFKPALRQASPGFA